MIDWTTYLLRAAAQANREAGYEKYAVSLEGEAAVREAEGIKNDET